jgi:hypothetical protein
MDDLISRAAALEAIDAVKGIVWSQSGKVLCGKMYSQIKDLPAVDAAPVVHAHWIETKIPANTTGHGGVGQDKKNGWLCSNCRCVFDSKLLWCQNYCPNCGARMDGDPREVS